MTRDFEFKHFFEGKSFQWDYTSHNFKYWAPILDEARIDIVNILEIGSLEGRSAVFFLNYLPRSKIVCIDIFVRQNEPAFDANLAEFGDRVEKRSGYSSRELPELAIDKRVFDLVYIDGDHDAAPTFSDALLAWSMLRPNGILVFDDYEWPLGATERERPKLGIDTFLRTIDGEYEELHRGWQVIIRKRTARSLPEFFRRSYNQLCTFIKKRRAAAAIPRIVRQE